MNFQQRLQKRLKAAQGRAEADWIIRQVRYLDVFTCRWNTGDVAVCEGVIVGVEPGLRARREIDGRGRWLVPGFIDAHVHIESSMMTPRHFEEAVLAQGTTAALCDPHEIANVMGVDGLKLFLDASEDAARAGSVDLWIMLSSCVPATHLETNGGGSILAPDLMPLRGHPRGVGLAEVMNVPGVLAGDPQLLQKLEAFVDRPRDGHAPLLRGQALSAYLTAGMTSCHECSQKEEASEKISKGMAVWVREGSVAKDLRELAPLLTLSTSTSMGFCTDDRNPLDIAQEGHIDHLVRAAIAAGVVSEVAYRASSWSVARHYGLDRGEWRTGAVAPGYSADLVLLNDEKRCEIAQVWKRGVEKDEIFSNRKSVLQEFPSTVHAVAPSEADLFGPEGQVHVIEIKPGKILTGRSVKSHDAPDVARLSVLERHRRDQVSARKPANAYVSGFGAGLQGAIASSVGHDSHNLIVVGKSPRDMRVALNAIIECGGGFAVAGGGEVRARLPLPFAGLMSSRMPDQLKKEIQTLKAAARSVGCVLEEPFLQLAFLSLPVIPSLKLTDRGLVDVEAFQIIGVRAS